MEIKRNKKIMQKSFACYFGMKGPKFSMHGSALICLLVLFFILSFYFSFFPMNQTALLVDWSSPALADGLHLRRFVHSDSLGRRLALQRRCQADQWGCAGSNAVSSGESRRPHPPGRLSVRSDSRFCLQLPLLDAPSDRLLLRLGLRVLRDRTHLRHRHQLDRHLEVGSRERHERRSRRRLKQRRRRKLLKHGAHHNLQNFKDNPHHQRHHHHQYNIPSE